MSCSSVSSISAGDTIECSGTRSCQDSTITGAPNIIGYGTRSLANALISSGGLGDTVSMNFYGYGSLDGATITCELGDICNINCYGNACANSELICIGVCTLNCDESDCDNCPNVYLSPTSDPTPNPTQIPSSSPTHDPTGIN